MIPPSTGLFALPVRIFLSYPSEARETVSRVNYALLALGHDVFFDRDDLPPGLEYDAAIARAVETSDLFVAFLTPDAVAQGRYAATELHLAEQKWPHPGGHVLPVLLQPVDFAAIPPYLRAVSVLEPRGDTAAEVAAAVRRMERELGIGVRARSHLRGRTARLALGAVVLVVVAAAVWLWRARAGRDPGYVPLPGDLRHRVRVVEAVPGGYVAALANPSALVRVAADGTAGRPLPLPGEPAALDHWVRSDGRLFVYAATRGTAGVVLVDGETWEARDTFPLHPERVVRSGAAGRVSPEIRSVALANGRIWVTTGGGGRPALLHFTRDSGWVNDTLPGQLADDTRLRTHRGHWLYVVPGGRTRSPLYHVYGNAPWVFAKAVADSVPSTTCARDLAESVDHTFFLVSCEGKLEEVTVDGSRFFPVRTLATLPVERDPSAGTVELLAADSGAVLVALSRHRAADGRPERATILRVAHGVATPLAEVRRAAVTSLAITPRQVIAVLLRANGTTEAITIPR